MMANRRLALSLLCAAAPLSAALLTAGPAVAADPAQAQAACGASAADYSGTFEGTFDNAPGDTLAVTFAAPQSVETNWTVEGWQGAGRGTYEVTGGGVEWNNADTITGPATGVDTETYRVMSVSCAAGTTEAETLRGEVVAPTASGTVSYPFTVVRQA
ncbi:hypothetical protein [Actinacidiphila epipremni]|uniref:Uncharacterized protein n=1 Tax=Actinacidiphila epipremni TaxID=2053013 RepID=A0ABX0ZNT3_9ACTN|nr:hypothetical protein [Actinacidiphila epipremni]NJP43484.1 hypothetical protein [Actinacidiphila epipremni]